VAAFATQGAQRIGDRIAILDNDVDQQVTAIRPRRNLIDEQIAADVGHARIREREVQRPLHLSAELLGFPLQSGDCWIGYCPSLHRESLRSPRPNANLGTPPFFLDDFAVSKQSSPVARKRAEPTNARVRMRLQLMS
jgi:hypothetical protein